MTFTITTQPYYDSYTQCYKNILLINIIPNGPLRLFVRRMKFPRLSTLHGYRSSIGCNNIAPCGFVLHKFGFCNDEQNIGYNANIGYNNYDSGCNLMTPNDVPELITFLLSHGYQIETQITNMLNQSEVKLTNQRTVLSATYYGQNQPQIVYTR